MLKQHGHIHLFIIGDGPYRPELQARAANLGASNLRFLPLQPRDKLPAQLAVADLLVITQKAAVTDVVFPGKLLYYMAVARPIVAAVASSSETGRFISCADVGVVVPPEDPSALANELLRLSGSNLADMGANNRRVVEQEFDKRVVLPRFVRRLVAIAG